MNRIQLLSLFLATVLLPCSVCFADQYNEAYRLFSAGKNAFEDGDLNQAQRILEQAIALQPNDQTLTINRETRFRLKPGASGITAQKVVEGDPVSYYPNKILGDIRTQIGDRKERARKTEKSNRHPALLVLTELVDEDADGLFQTEEPLKLRLTVRNVGSGTAENVRLQLSNKHHLDIVTGSWDLGEITSNSEVLRQTSFTLPREFDDVELELNVVTEERDGYSADTVTSTYNIVPWSPPQFEIQPAMVHSELVAGRASTIDYRLINAGTTPVRNVSINAEFNQQGLTLIEQKWPERFQTVRPGETLQLSLTLKAAIEFEATIRPEIRFVLTDWAIMDLKKRHTTVASFATEIIPTSMRYQVGNPLPAFSQKTTVLAITDGYAPKLSPNPVKQRKSYALIIGNRDYTQAPYPVPYALNDANLMQKVFEEVVGIPNDHILRFDNATLADFRTTLGSDGDNGRLQNIVNEQTNGRAETLYVYYSGHGIPAKNRNWAAYLMPSDANADYIEQSGYSLESLYEQLALVNARHIIVFLDACFSGQTPDGILFPNTSVGVLKLPELPRQIRDSRISVLSAASAEDMGLWLNQAQQGLFTTYLARGLSGLADHDDKALTIEELYDYVKTKVTAASTRLARSQTPTLQGKRDTLFLEYGY